MQDKLKTLAELLTHLTAKDAAAIVTEAARALEVGEQRLAAAMVREEQLRADLVTLESRAQSAEARAAEARAECERLHAHPEVRAAKAAALKAQAERLAAQAAALESQPAAE